MRVSNLRCSPQIIFIILNVRQQPRPLAVLLDPLPCAVHLQPPLKPHRAELSSFNDIYEFRKIHRSAPVVAPFNKPFLLSQGDAEKSGSEKRRRGAETVKDNG
jgi:hypothetical protein